MSEANAKAGVREWLGLAVLALPVVLISIDVSVLFIALPALTSELKPEGSQLLWILDIYAFLLSGLLVTMGTLGDRIGRKRLLMIGAVAFGAASLLAAYSTSAETLIIARALQGVGGATLMPSTLSLIRNMFHDRKQRTIAIGVWTSSVSAGLVIGPLVGGALLNSFWWGSVFVINVPIMLLLLVAGWFLLPEYKDPNPGKFDLVSSLLSLLAVLPVIYGIKHIAEKGAFDWLAGVSIVAGLAFGYVFARRQRRLETPMIDVQLFKRPAFSAALMTNLSVFVATAGITLFTTQYLQLVLDMRPLTAGLWALTGAGASALGATLAPVIVQWIRQVYVLAIGLAIAAAGFVLMTQLTTDSLGIVITGNAIGAAGLGMVVTMVVDIVVASAPPEKAGAASALSETCTEFGGALGIAVLGSVGNAIYTAQFKQNVPQGLPAELVEMSGNTLAAAKEVTAQVPELADSVLHVAEDAFVHGAQVIATISAAIMAAIAVLTVLTLRRLTVKSGAGEEHAKTAA